MSNSKSSPSVSDGDTQGRANQRLRTRQALLDAAVALRDEGLNPTVAQVAERARVSRATAYRYFPSPEALISETAADRDMQPLEHLWQPGDDPVKGIGLAANALNKLLIEDEIGLHMMERSFMTVWLDSETHEPLRPGRRMSYIAPIVDSLKDELSPRARKRLKQALSIVMGTEALIAVRDISQASIEESLDTAAWAARALMRQALEEDEQARRKRKARSVASPD